MDQSVAETSSCCHVPQSVRTWQNLTGFCFTCDKVMHCFVPNSLCPNFVCVVHIFHSALLWHTEVTGMASCLSWYWFLFMLHQASFWYWTVQWLSDACVLLWSIWADDLSVQMLLCMAKCVFRVPSHDVALMLCENKFKHQMISLQMMAALKWCVRANLNISISFQMMWLCENRFIFLAQFCPFNWRKHGLVSIASGRLSCTKILPQSIGRPKGDFELDGGEMKKS